MRIGFYNKYEMALIEIPGKTEAFIQLVSEAVLEGFKPYQVVLGI